MFSMTVIALINVWLILSPAQFLVILLELMNVPASARFTLFFGVVINVVISMAYENWGSTVVSSLIGFVLDGLRSRRRIRDGKTYKAIESGMH